MASPYVGLETLGVNQFGKETTINNNDGRLEEATQKELAVDMTSGNILLTEAQFGGNHLFICSSQTADRTLTLPNAFMGQSANTAERTFAVRNDSPDYNVTVTQGGVSVIVLPKTTVALKCDGTDVSRVDTGMIIAGFAPGVPTSNQLLLQFVATEAFTLPVGLVGAQAYVGVATTAITAYVVQKNGAGSLGTIDFGAAGQVATFTFTTATDFVAGDRLSILAPASPDATAADLSFSLSANRK